MAHEPGSDWARSGVVDVQKHMLDQHIPMMSGKIYGLINIHVIGKSASLGD
jgi:hypothetical protein